MVYLNTLFSLFSITLFADHAWSVLPLSTIYKFASSFCSFFIIFITSLTIVSLIILASVNYTWSSLKFIMWEAVYTNSSVISKTAFLYRLTCSIFSDIESTLTSNTSKVIESLAMSNITVVSIALKWWETLFTSMINILVSAS